MPVSGHTDNAVELFIAIDVGEIPTLTPGHNRQWEKRGCRGFAGNREASRNSQGNRLADLATLWNGRRACYHMRRRLPVYARGSMAAVQPPDRPARVNFRELVRLRS
jgi:hypothetical protein